jgi:uncharacterized tellurite resistance protein B-like protein
MPDEENNEPPWGKVPVPDPTKLTSEAVRAATAQFRLELEKLQELQETKLAALKDLLDERYATQTKALDAAFVAAEKAVKTALDSAETAVRKAETANERRFETVDKFRIQLSDQIASFMTRNEASVRIDSIAEKLDTESSRLSKQLNDLELRVTSRLDLNLGAKQGTSTAMAAFIATASVVIALIVATVTIVSTR